MNIRFHHHVISLLAWVFLPMYANGQAGPILNENIKPLHFQPLDYPLIAKLKRVQGTVVVRAELKQSGEVAAAKAISGPQDLLAETIANVKKWHFRPNQNMAVIVIYHFRRVDGLCELPCPSQFLFVPPNVATITVGEPTISHGVRTDP